LCGQVFGILHAIKEEIEVYRHVNGQQHQHPWPADVESKANIVRRLFEGVTKGGKDWKFSHEPPFQNLIRMR
jgi:hypothetical protein